MEEEGEGQWRRKVWVQVCSQPLPYVAQCEGRGWRTRLGRMVQCVEKRRV